MKDVNRAVDVIALVLATRRLTHLVVDDKITEPVRDAIFMSFGYSFWIRYLLTCTRCTSVWAAIVVLMLSRHRATKVIASILALSEASIIIDEIEENTRTQSLMG